MFFKPKKEVIATFYDEKEHVYELVKECQKRWLDKKGEEITEILLYRGREAIAPWEAPMIKLNLSSAPTDAVNCFVDDYLKGSSNIRGSLVTMVFPMESLLHIWNGIYNDNKFMKETLLVYQDILYSHEFIENLPHELKWVVLTQNVHRTKENMNKYETVYQEVIAEFLSLYLSKENIDKHERVYGEWQKLIVTTFQEFYSENLMTQAVQMAIQKSEDEIKKYELELELIKKDLKELDNEYEKALLSQKIKIEEHVKEVLEKEKSKIEEIKETTEKISRIKSFL